MDIPGSTARVTGGDAVSANAARAHKGTGR